VSAIHDAQQVAVVGSPSTNYEVTLDLLDAATHEPLVGSMLLLAQPLAGGQELALGTVTEVTTVNQWHTNALLRGVVKTRGEIPGMSGDVGDVRAATIRLQACYKRSADGQDLQPWTQSGPSLRMSPPTGTPVRKVTNEVVDELMAGEDDLHYLGHLHGTQVRVPMSIRDFSGDRGAFHAAICGQSGSGKTIQASLIFAGQMRHHDHGMIIIDPQGQWSSETGMPYSLQEWAREMGREVTVRRVSEDLRLEKDAVLFGDLLAKTKFTGEITKMAPETAGYLIDELAKIVKKRSDWEREDSASLLQHLLDRLADPSVLGRIYADENRQTRLAEALQEASDDDTRFADLMRQFSPLHNLFGPINPGGQPRHSLWGTISAVFDKQARGGGPAPLLILDMSTSGEVSWVKDLLADEDQQQMLEALRVLDQDGIKAAILRQACRTLKHASEAAFRGGETLNTMVVFDEAWRYAPPVHLASDDEIKELSKDLAGYARDTRKFGIGWFYITQSPRSLNGDIWDQLSIRILGYGLGGADLAKVAEQMDDPDHLKLYRSFAPPDSTKPKVYPFMVLGPVSPLSFTKAPVMLSAYTDFDVFRADNEPWIRRIRDSQGLPLQTGAPVLRRRPATARPAARPVPRQGPRGGTMAAIAAQADRIRAHRDNGGVDPASSVGLSRDSGFSGGLGWIDDDAPMPF
jgi:hypothetical protein